MGWLYLVLAGFFEIGFTTFLKFSMNFTRLWPTIGFLVFAIFSFTSLSLSLRSIPLGTAYAVWTGIGAFGTAIMGIILFNEPANFWRVFFLIGLIASIIGLKFVSE